MKEEIVIQFSTTATAEEFRADLNHNKLNYNPHESHSVQGRGLQTNREISICCKFLLA